MSEGAPENLSVDLNCFLYLWNKLKQATIGDSRP